MTEPAPAATGHVTYVYRLYDRAGRLLYVGITANVRTRLKAHEKKPWWPQVHRHTIHEHPTRAYALAAEALAILEEAPRYNIARPREDGPERFYADGAAVPQSPHDPAQVVARAHDRIESLERELRVVRAALTAATAARDALLRQPERPSQYQQTVIRDLRTRLRASEAAERAATKRAEKAEYALGTEKLRRIVRTGR